MTPGCTEVMSAWPQIPRVLATLNTRLDRLVKPRVRLFGRSIPCFHVCGCVGLALAFALSQFVATYCDLSALVMALLALVAMVAFLAVGLLTTVIVGRETLVYLHHEVAILVTSGGVLWALDLPVLAYLDAVVLGVGGFLVCGRVGCLLVGCCHGRPAQWGVRYGPDHAREGFFAPYVGLRLLPVPLFESLWVLFVVAIGIGIVIIGYAPGAALAWYVSAYGLGRFGLEFLRGDLHRPYLGGLSHNQWLTLLLALVAAVAGLLGAVPAGVGLISEGVFFTLALFSVLIIVTRRRGCRWPDIVHPRHVAEVAALLYQWPAREEDALFVGTTSLGVQLSMGFSYDGGHHTHYGLSGKERVLSPQDASRLARALLRVRHAESRGGMLVSGHSEIFHLIVPATVEGTAVEAESG